ncbi:hypothetical protein Dsin_018416 [Dipteronia sinensis]|uniref:PARP1-like PADR1 domain-containing protein n=1 Tax=Dipteronia sinensis TaxID=43782 RepID=A0AAE0E1S2_9ROSI|nr:hypothetical protein Dsin_018416 [Dipteronia sinensis]
METKLEIQTKEPWALKDDLKKHVTTLELHEILEANGQDSTGSELDLLDRRMEVKNRRSRWIGSCTDQERSSANGFIGRRMENTYD